MRRGEPLPHVSPLPPLPHVSPPPRVPAPLPLFTGQQPRCWYGRRSGVTCLRAGPAPALPCSARGASGASCRALRDAANITASALLSGTRRRACSDHTRRRQLGDAAGPGTRAGRAGFPGRSPGRLLRAPACALPVSVTAGVRRSAGQRAGGVPIRAVSATRPSRRPARGGRNRPRGARPSPFAPRGGRGRGARSGRTPRSGGRSAGEDPAPR